MRAHISSRSQKTRFAIQRANAQCKLHLRSAAGVQLLELMIAVSVGAIVMMAIYGSSMGFYRATANNENQVLASNMAQQVIDNARNSTYHRLLTHLDGNATVSQDLSLYDFPSNPAGAMFPRPLLRNQSSDSGMSYTEKSLSKVFKGNVTQTIDNLTPGNANNGQLRVRVLVAWDDTKGHHEYHTATTIAQTGIHN